MKKFLFFMLFLTVLGAVNMNAQVTIGSGAEPHPGAVVDLQSNGIRGLNMPQVSLTSATAWTPIAGSPVEGMIVFNTSGELDGKGIYVWIDNAWNKISTTPPVRPSAPICDGVTISMGAYNSPGLGEYNSNWSGVWNVDWTGGDKFTPLNKDLCWARKDLDVSQMTWNEAQACPGDWRLPNLRELQELYNAIGGAGGGASTFENLKYPNYNPVNAVPLAFTFYWSSTESVAANAYSFSFANGERADSPKTIRAYTRCVREL